MRKKLEKIQLALFKETGKRIGPLAWLSVFFGVIVIRLFLDDFVAKSNNPSLGPVMYIHNLFFFFLLFLLVWLFLAYILQEKPAKLSYLMLWATLLIILPPIFDMLKTGGSTYWSGYLIGNTADLWRWFIGVFSHLPSGMLYFGTKIVFILVALLSGAWVYLKSRSFFKSVFTVFGIYVLVFFMGAFPSFFTFIYYFFAGSKNLNNISTANIIQLVGAPVTVFALKPVDFSLALAYNLNLVYFLLILAISSLFFAWNYRSGFWAILKNWRYPQLVYHDGLFFCGMGLGLLAYPENLHLSLFSVIAVLVLLFSIGLAWETSVIVNDIYDYEIDAISNPERPLQKGIFKIAEYREIGIIFFISSLLGGMIVGFKFAALLLVYQIIAWFYSAPPLRLKRFPVIATLASASASLIVLFMGFALLSGDANLAGLSWRIIFLLLLVLTLALPVKDFKDIAGDRRYGVWTIPVLLGETQARLVVGTGVFISFMASVFFLNELRLFIWALIFGCLAFFILVNEKIKPANLFWRILGVTFLYGLALVKVVFL
ncbi:MAG: UbiA family prenyltransferase [Candidatus Moranbacteria bacterium]|nr:UbiA family prenyltransferase [Candidatus Moranbacteria bacterium]